MLLLPPYKEGPVLSHSPPLWLDSGLSGSGPNVAQLSTLPGWCPWSLVCLLHFVLIPLPETSSNQVSLSAAQALFGRGGSREQRSLPGVLRQALWAGAWGCSCPGPCTGPRDLFVLKQSPYRLFFQCPLYFLVSYLHKRWGAVGCSLCSSVDWLGVLPVCRGKWTLLPPISPPSFLSPFL